MKFTFKQFIVDHFWKKFILMTSGIFLMGFFLSFLIVADFGTDPYSFMNINLSRTLHLSLGNWQLIFNILLFVVVFLFGSEMIGFGTIFNMVFIGYVADFFCALWEKLGLYLWVENSALWIHILFFFGALLLFVIVASLYMNAEMGLSPYDGTGKIIANCFSKVPFFIVRIAYDLMAILIGYVAGLFNPEGVQGSIIGGIAMAFLLGPAITLVGKFVRKYILNFSE